MLCKFFLFIVVIVICFNVVVLYYNVFYGEFYCGSSCIIVLYCDCGFIFVCYIVVVVIF